MSNAYERRKAMINILRENYSQEDVEALCGNEQADNYGETEEISNEEASRGRYEALHKGEKVPYYVPSDGAWLSGSRVTMEKAYRIIGESDDKTKIRRVQNPSELESVKQAMIERAREILRRRRK
tara:strand:+ start:358 stop:732 length:375 start_codon:yes stop_codon:yes gene_type:complete